MKTTRCPAAAPVRTKDHILVWRENIRILIDIAIEAIGPLFAGGGFIVFVLFKIFGGLSWLGFTACLINVFFIASTLLLVPAIKRDCENMVRYHILKHGQSIPVKMEYERRFSATLAMSVVKVLLFGTLPFLGVALSVCLIRIVTLT